LYTQCGVSTYVYTWEDQIGYLAHPSLQTHTILLCWEHSESFPLAISEDSIMSTIVVLLWYKTLEVTPPPTAMDVFNHGHSFLDTVPFKGEEGWKSPLGSGI
jgi:hypothetical protein